jgi:ankyrin repeat protein
MEAGLNMVELLLAKSKEGLTALHLAAQKNQTEILQKLWVWAEEVLVNASELKYKLLLAKDNYRNTAFDLAREGLSAKALHKL